MELLNNFSEEEEEDRVAANVTAAMLRLEETTADSTVGGEMNHIKIRRLEIHRRRQQRKERRARKANKEAATINGIGRASKRRRDRSESGGGDPRMAEEAAYEG